MNDPYAALIAVAEAYGSDDDWGVLSIYIGTLEHLADLLRAGVTVDQIVAHADHTGRGCCFLFAFDREGA